MSKNLAVTALSKPRLAKMTTEDLRRELGEAIGLTARAIARVAVIWDELTRRGEDLSGYKFALRDYMHAVASGRLLPEAVAQLAGRIRTLDLVAQLPVEEQQRLVDGDPVELLTADGVVQKPLSDLTWPEAARIIRNGHILSPQEQEIAMSRMQAARRRSRRGRPPRILVDTAAGELRVGTASVPVERVLAALRSAGLITQPE